MRRNTQGGKELCFLSQQNRISIRRNITNHYANSKDQAVSFSQSFERSINNMKHPTIQIIFRILLIMLLTVIGLFLLYHFLRLTYPFLIAALFAFLINPIIFLLEKYLRFPRPIAVLTSILFLFGIIGGLVTILVKVIIEGILYLSDYIPSQIEQISTNIQNYFNEYILPLWDQGIGLLDNVEEGQRQALQEGILIVGNNVAALLGNFGQGIANSITAFIGALPIKIGRAS